MKMRKVLSNILIIISIISFSISGLKAQIQNVIVVKIGNSMITSLEIRNEILTSLFLDKQNITQEKINEQKNYAVKKLINKSIKRDEINKYKIKDYNKKDLKNYIQEVAKNFNTNIDGLKKTFKENNISYDLFVKNYETELLWNTLIFQMYNSQININIVELENDIANIKKTGTVEFNLSEIAIPNPQYNANKLKEILESVNKESFEITAKKFSNSITAEKGGLVGWVKEESLSKNYINIIKNMKPGEISKPILEKNSVLILKVNDIKKNNTNANLKDKKNKILLGKKQEKLSMFSRSHFSKLKSDIIINFQ